MIKRPSRHGELLIAEKCVADGAVCNEPRDDQNGWDLIIEISRASIAHLPPDKQPALLTALAQTKTTTGNTLNTKIKLSNALKAAQSELPCFVFLVSYAASVPRVYGKHVWSTEIERILLKSRESERLEPKPLNKAFLELKFGPEDQIDSGIVEWIELKIGSVDSDYAACKRKLRETCGYDKGNGTGIVTIGPLEAFEQIADHQIGLIEDLPISQFTYHDERFGIRSALPTIDITEGRLKIDPPQPQAVILKVSGTNIDHFEMPASILIPNLIQPE